jgi:hypothetical protein
MLNITDDFSIGKLKINILILLSLSLSVKSNWNYQFNEKFSETRRILPTTFPSENWEVKSSNAFYIGLDTSIYIGLGLQHLPQTIDAWVDALLSLRIIKRISSQVCRLSEWYLFQASPFVVSATCWSIYL